MPRPACADTAGEPAAALGKQPQGQAAELREGEQSMLSQSDIVRATMRDAHVPVYSRRLAPLTPPWLQSARDEQADRQLQSGWGRASGACRV